MSTEQIVADETQRIGDIHSVPDIADRLEYLAVLPMYTTWRRMQDEMQAAAREIRHLRGLVRELNDDGA